MSELSTVISSNASIGGTSVSVVPPTGSRRAHLHSTVNSQSGPGPGPFVVVKSIAPRHSKSVHHSSVATSNTSSSFSSNSGSSRQAPSVVGAKTKPDVPSLVTVSPSSGNLNANTSGRPSMTSTVVNHCDNGVSQSQQHSLTNYNSNKSFNNNSPTNYILLNKLRIGQARNRGKSTTANVTSSRPDQSNTQPSSLSLSQKSISTVNAPVGSASSSHRRGSSAGPARITSSNTSSQHLSSRPVSGQCNSSTLSSVSSSRPVITRINAHEWLSPSVTPAFSNGNHSSKDVILTNVAIKSRAKDSLEVKVNQKSSRNSAYLQQRQQARQSFAGVEHRTIVRTDPVKDLASSRSVSHDSVEEKLSETIEVTFPESTIPMNFPRHTIVAGSCDNAFDSAELVSTTSTSGLEKFIENLSPEMIFLLNECAKLCINLRVFDEKLNEMQRVFVSGSLKDSNQSRQWTRVIERSRKWLRNVRMRNQFLSRLEKTVPRSGTASDSDWIDDSSSGAEDSSLSTEDELLHLLDRIAKFSSDLLLKTEAETVLKADVSFGSLAALKSGNFDSDPEWLRSLPVGLQSILKPVFQSGSTSDDSNGNDTGIHCDFVQMSDMNPLVLEKLVENVQANSRLAQLQREFDRLLCTHLKSSLSKTDSNLPQCDSAPGSTSGSSFYTSLPATKPLQFATQNRLLSGNSRTSQQIAFQKQTTQLPVHISTTEPVSDLSAHQHIAHTLLTPEMAAKTSQNGTTAHCCNCSGSANLISDNDSGGEFTATTVTNEFQQSSSASATEDELSSLLNQIALCSQKIIQETSGTGSAPSSSTSTSVGCCCSSTSIEPQNKWLAPNHHAHINPSGHLSLVPQGLLGSQSHSLYRHSSSKFLNRSQNIDCCNAQQEAQFHWSQNDLPEQNCCGPNVYPCQPINRTMRSQSHFSPAREYSRRFGDMHKSQSSSSLKMRRSFSHHPNHVNFMSQQQQQPSQQQQWASPYEDDYHMQHQQPFYENENFSKSKHQHKVSGAIFRERSQFSLSDAVMDCFTNNMTGFMLSNSAIDVLSPPEASPISSSPLTLPVTERNRKQMGVSKLTPAGEVLSGSNTLDSFMLDPNMDVESFLNEMEKELEDNCYTSAPNYESRYGFEATLPVHQASHARMQMMSQLSSPKHSPYYSPVRNVLPSKHSQHNSHAYQYFHSSPKDPLTLPVHSIVPGSEHHSTSTSNWRLSQRNSVVDLQNDKSASQNLHNLSNGHFPFPSMTSMPNGSVCHLQGTTSGSLGPSSPGVHGAFRRLVPSSNGRDLLDKFRAQVITKANHDADQQLKQIDHWLSNHLNDGTNIETIPHLDDDSADDDDEDADGEGKTLAVSQNLIHFS